MNLDGKIGQLFCVAARGVFMNESAPAWRELVRHVRDNQVGGFIWFVSNVFEAAWMGERLQSLARVPLLVSADLESGAGMRFIDATWWPPAMALAAAGDLSLAEEQARITAREARAIGVNQILAPVADVNVNPANPVINTRSFGEDPHEVARYVVATIRGIRSEGLLATAKHFPGHGDTAVDSHRSLPLLDVSRERLESVELVPFRAAIEAGVDSIMMGHLAVPAIDATRAPVRERFENVYGTDHSEVPDDATLPATVSRPAHDLLRRDLGFRGLIITDAFDMGGLAAHFDPGEAAVRAIEAGEDQVLYSTDTDAAIAAVREAVRSGRLSQGRIDESVERILEAKRRVPKHELSLDEVVRVVDAPAHLAVAREIARRSIAVAWDRAGVLPLDARDVTAVVVTDFVEENPLRDAVKALAPSRVFFLDSRSHESEADAVTGDCVVLMLALRPKSGAGRIAMPRAAKILAEKKGRHAVAIAFGSPYVAREVPAVGAFLCAWGIQPILQQAAIEVLRGEQPVRGRVPVTL